MANALSIGDRVFSALYGQTGTIVDGSKYAPKGKYAVQFDGNSGGFFAPETLVRIIDVEYGVGPAEDEPADGEDEI